MKWREAAEELRQDLTKVVGARLRALVVYEAHGALGDVPPSPQADGGIRHEDLVHALGVIDDLSADDLGRLAALAGTWEKRHLAVPLLVPPQELARSLDAFPLEFSQILSHYVLVAGTDPFEGLRLDRQDLRRACETQAKSHLLHLREGYLQAGGDARKVNDLVAASAAPLRALLVNLARLHGDDPRTAEALLQFLEQHLALSVAGLRPVVLLGTRQERLHAPQRDALFPAYLRAVEDLVRLVDEWTL